MLSEYINFKKLKLKLITFVVLSLIFSPFYYNMLNLPAYKSIYTSMLSQTGMYNRELEMASNKNMRIVTFVQTIFAFLLYII